MKCYWLLSVIDLEKNEDKHNTKLTKVASNNDIGHLRHWYTGYYDYFLIIWVWLHYQVSSDF